MQAAVDHCQTAADVWAAAARVKAWRASLKPPVRRIRIECRDRTWAIPIVRPKRPPGPGFCPAKFVQQRVADKFHIPFNDILSRRHDRAAVLPRHVAIYVLKSISLMSLPEIGRRFGDRDHTTILHALRKIEKMIEADFDLKQTVESLIKECKP